MYETNKLDNNGKLIDCSRCKCKYHNTSESISKHFGYKRLGDRYKLCMRCKASTDIKECCVCMKRLNKNNSVKIKCNHGICKCCLRNMYNNIYRTNIIKCPICRREYTFQYELNNVEPILFKIHFRNNAICGHSHPTHLCNYTSRTDLFVTVDREFIADEIWLKRMNIIGDLLLRKNAEPITFYIYKDGDKSFTLKTCKPKYDDELVELFDFTDKLQQDDEIIEKSIPLFSCG
jgi:hypothetical protein